MKRKYWIFRTI